MTWVNHDWSKVKEYRRRRQDDVQGYMGKPGDCFHTGFELLPSVKQIHEELIANSRNFHDVTPLIVNECIRKMLLIGADDRPEAKRIALNSGDEIEKAERLLHPDQDLPSGYNVEAQTNTSLTLPRPPVRHRKKSKPPPEMSVTEGLGYKFQMIGSRRKFPDQQLFGGLNGRDHVSILFIHLNLTMLREPRSS